MKRYEEHPDGGMREDELGAYVKFDDADAEIKRIQDLVTSSEQERYRGAGKLVANNVAIMRLQALLAEVEAVMAKNIYPKPDVGPEHPWSVLQRVRAALPSLTKEKQQ